MWKPLLLFALCLLSSKAPRIEGGELRAIVLGDWGERLLNGQDKVAAGMAIWAAENNPHFILTTGDNIYPRGMASPDDPNMDRKWRNVYDNESLVDLDWYVSVGNHDYGDDGTGREWNEVGFSDIEPRWNLPHLWHDLVVDLDDHSVHFVLIDTEAHRMQVNNYTDMLDWMEATLSQSTADWKFVVGHRHTFACGDIDPVTEGIVNDLVPIMERNNVDAYIYGHDHNLEHFRNISGKGMDHILSGNGGALPSYYTAANEEYIRDVYQMRMLYFQYEYGFITLRSSPTEVVFDFYDKDALLTYSYTRTHAKTD